MHQHEATKPKNTEMQFQSDCTVDFQLNNTSKEFLSKFFNTFLTQLNLTQKQSVNFINFSHSQDAKKLNTCTIKGNPEIGNITVTLGDDITYLAKNGFEDSNHSTKSTKEGLGFILSLNLIKLVGASGIKKELAEQGYYISSLLRLPQNFIQGTSVRPILGLIRKVNDTNIFVAEFDNEMVEEFGQFERLSNNLIDYLFPGHIDKVRQLSGQPSFVFEIEDAVDERIDYGGVIVDSTSFAGFRSYKALETIEGVMSDYDHYSYKTIGEVATSVNLVSDVLKSSLSRNTVLFSLAGNEVIGVAETLFHQKPGRFIAVEVNSSEVKPNYLVDFFRSRIGKVSLDCERYRGDRMVPSLTVGSVKRLAVYIPDLNAQKKISDHYSKFRKIVVAVKEFEDELNLRPLSSDAIYKLDNILMSLGSLSAPERVRNLINKGEDKKTEFKSSLSYCFNTKQKQKYIEHAIVKSIGAFMNTDGGTLLIGISDDGEVKGLEMDISKFYKDQDGFKKQFTNMFKTSIGLDKTSLIATTFLELEDKLVFEVQVQASDDEVFVNGDEFWVRSDPASSKLEGQQLLDYCRKRFSN